MRVRVRLYAVLKDLYGSAEDYIELEGERARVRDVIEKISGRSERIRGFIESRGESVIVLVNGLYAPLETEVRDGDTVDILPPASGGGL